MFVFTTGFFFQNDFTGPSQIQKYHAHIVHCRLKSRGYQKLLPIHCYTTSGAYVHLHRTSKNFFEEFLFAHFIFKGLMYRFSR